MNKQNDITQTLILPQHIAIIMDGNGRWAKMRNLSRISGHRIGVQSVKDIVKACNKKGIKILTLFAFSTENWQRPVSEVKFLMSLITSVIQKEIKEFHNNNVKLQVIGNKERLSPKILQAIEKAEKLTVNNTGLKLVIALDYSGRWDLTQAITKIAKKINDEQITLKDINEDFIDSQLVTEGMPYPDLVIRTSNEKRISNFMLWQIAYTELYFTDVFWPDFRESELDMALADYAKRQRRFGKTGDQLC